MALNSIASLAVKIIADTFGLSQGFDRAGKQTKQWANNVEGGNRKLSLLGKQAITASGALGRMGGLATSFGMIGGPIGVAAVAATALAVGLARAADASEDFRIEKLREIGRIGPEIKTTADYMGELREQFAAFAELSGLSLKPLLSDFSQASKLINEAIFGEKKMADLAKENLEARRAGELLAPLKRRADELKKTVRTPFEIFADTIGELRSMREEGFIAGETLTRGANRAAEAYRDATDKVHKMKDALIGIPALEMGTAGARTAILKASTPLTSRASGPESKMVIDLLKSIDASAKAEVRKPPVIFKKGEL